MSSEILQKFLDFILNIKDIITNSWVLLVLPSPSWTLSLSCLQTPRCSANCWETKLKKSSVQSVGLFSPKYQNIKPCEMMVWKSKNFTGVVRFPVSEPVLLSPVERHQVQSEGLKNIQEEVNKVCLTGGKNRYPPLRWGAHTSGTIAPDINSTARGTHSCQGAVSIQYLCFQKGFCARRAVRVSYTNMTLRTLLRTE